MRPALSASLVLAGWLAAAPAAFAQTAPAPAAPAPAAPAAQVPASQAPALGASARAQCRAQIDSRSLTGPERKAAMRDCMRPQRDACRDQAVARGLAKGPDRKTFMHQCLHGTLAQGQ